MTYDRWQRVKELFQATVERPPEERAAFLATAAADDDLLRREVQSLLASDGEDVSFLDRLPVAAEAVLAESVTVPPLSTGETQSHPALNPHDRVGSYEVVALLGVGGMGEVYLARDARLNREVALKLLPTAFALDPDRLARFRREAQILAALNHPNIAAIYGLEESTDVQALVLELVDGPTLSDRIEQGPIPCDEALLIAAQIAEALEAAHEHGIIHRDLKPSNVKVRPDGVLKVLDFGLAKALASEPVTSEAPNNANSPTADLAATRDGIILGTAAYISPEQAKGQAVDKRADIWAFGCVLFEMLTGRPAFRGDTLTDVLAAVVKQDPDWGSIPGEVPPRFRTLLRRCLKKDPRQRLQAIGDARIEIEETEGVSQVEGNIRQRRLGWPERVGWIAAVGVLVLVATGALTRALRPSAELPETRLEITVPATTDPASLAIAPDGQKIVFSAMSAEGRPQLWIRFLTDIAARPLASTDDGRHPFWSPDSQSIGFFANGRLKRVDVEGTSVREISDAPLGLGGTWNGTDTIVFSPDLVGPLLRVSAAGGTPATATRLNPQQTGHRFPQFLPDGRHFLFEAIESGGISGVVYVGDLEGAEAKKLVESGAAATYAPSGYLMFARGAPAGATLVAQRFDAARVALVGDPFRVADAISAGLDPGSAALSVSAAGLVAYRANTGAGQRQFVWFDRSGREVGKLGNADSAGPVNPALSSDSRHIALRRFVGENSDIWLIDTATGLLSRLTASAGLHNFPLWSPDNRSIAFTTNLNRAGGNDFYRKSANGTGNEELLLATPQNKGLSDWSPDGRFLLFRNVDPKTGNDIWAVSLEDRKPFPVVQTNFDERDGQFSPDGKWIAYQSNDTGSFEIWARPFPGPGSGARVRISNNGGAQVRWRRDGKELFYIAMDGRLMSVPVRFGPRRESLEAGTPVPLFATGIGGAFQGFNRHQYVVAPNGQRFLMNTVTAEATSTIMVIQNWKARPN